MKVFAALVLLIASTAALGSGPYLPSGWRPNGPAFYLPSEAQNPIDIILQGSEGASSDFLREYGPPTKNLNAQGLPEVGTEQSFDLEAKFGQEEATEVVFDAVTEVVQVPKGKALDIENENEAEVVIADISTISDDTDTEEGGKSVEEGINNIADAIGKVENEVQIAQDVTELRSGPSTESSRLLGGFLEYGPPDFREYGPPKQNSIETAGKDTNESRRRRFSPKFKTVRKQRSLRRRQQH